MDVVDPAGQLVRVSYDVVSVVGDVVTLTETTNDPDGAPLRGAHASPRFLGVDALARFLVDAGCAIEARSEGEFREPLCPIRPEIATVARV